MLYSVSRIALKATIVALLISAAAAPVLGEEEFREIFEARAVSMGTSNPPVIPTGTNATLQINITRWSTAKERDQILSQLRENGQKGLNTTLANQEETGWVRVTSRGTTRSRMPSERLRYARQILREDGSRQIVLALDRNISFAEAVSSPRWRDHDVTLIVLQVDKDGNGEGQLALGVRMTLDDQNNLKVENFGTEPVRLTNVRKR